MIKCNCGFFWCLCECQFSLLHSNIKRPRVSKQPLSSLRASCWDRMLLKADRALGFPEPDSKYCHPRKMYSSSSTPGETLAAFPSQPNQRVGL